MLVFLFISALLSLAAFIILYKPLQQTKPTVTESEDEYTTLYKQRKIELDSELENQAIEQSQYDEILASYQKQLYLDLNRKNNDSNNDILISNKGLNLIIALSAPILAIGIYFLIGGGELALQNTIPTMADLEQDPEQLLIAFEEKLNSEGGNAEQWHFLAKTYRDQKRFDEALSALDMALKQDSADIQMEADYVELLMLLNENKPTDESTNRLNKALDTDPNHPKLLWLAAIDASYKNNTLQQIGYLEKLATQIPEDAPQRDTIEKIIAATKGETIEPGTATSSELKELTIKVSIDKALEKNIQNSSVLFVYAKASSGPPMPLAVAKLDPNNIPNEVFLNDDMAMAPNMKLSNFDTVDVIALISHSGTAKSSSGDLQGSVNTISTDSKEIISININTIIP